MPIYAIGDVHGCRRTLESLVGVLPLDEERDQLWLTGDLVHRGPDSAGVLRWARAMERRLGERFVSVLGNHDLRLLAAWVGVSGDKGRELLRRVRSDAESEDLLEWLAHRPLLHQVDAAWLVHAGWHPRWQPLEIAPRARAAERMLRSSGRRDLLRAVEAGGDASDTLVEAQTVRVLSRIRTVDERGGLAEYAGPPELCPQGLVPWYQVLEDADLPPIVFGHWASMGFRMARRYLALDSGCAWGGALTCVRIEDRAVFRMPRLD